MSNKQCKKSEINKTFISGPKSEDLILTKRESNLLRILVEWNENSIHTLTMRSTVRAEQN